MFGSLLIGFEYTERENASGVETQECRVGSKKLPGTLVDLFIAKKFFQEKSKIENFKILTDVRNFNINFIDTLGEVDGQIFSFYPTGKETYVSNLDSLIEEIISYLKDLKFLCIYYSGHCVENKMVLPSEETIKIKDIEELILRINPDLEMCFILDCCDFKDNLKSFCICNLENPISTNKGSLFTKEFFGKKVFETKVPEWLLGNRLRLCKFLDFYILFNLDFHSTKDYLCLT